MSSRGHGPGGKASGRTTITKLMGTLAVLLSGGGALTFMQLAVHRGTELQESAVILGEQRTRIQTLEQALERFVNKETLRLKEEEKKKAAIEAAKWLQPSDRQCMRNWQTKMFNHYHGCAVKTPCSGTNYLGRSADFFISVLARRITSFRPALILDVGANDGESMREFWQRNGPHARFDSAPLALHSFEPVDATYQRLVQNARTLPKRDPSLIDYHLLSDTTFEPGDAAHPFPAGLALATQLRFRHGALRGNTTSTSTSTSHSASDSGESAAVQADGANFEVILHRAALSKTSGEQTIYAGTGKRPTDAKGSAVATLNAKGEPMGSVRLSTLDAFAAAIDRHRASPHHRAGNARPQTLLKIDTEGHDILVLLGGPEALASKRFDVIMIEVGAAMIDAGFQLKQAIDLLDQGGYDAYLIGPVPILLTGGLWDERFSLHPLGNVYAVPRDSAIKSELFCALLDEGTARAHRQAPTLRNACPDEAGGLPVCREYFY